MTITYEMIRASFLMKVTSYDFLEMTNEMVQTQIDKYMKQAITAFKFVCKYDLTTTADDAEQQFNVDVDEDDVEELVEIISNGMVVKWLKPYINRQELLENVLNTRDFTTYSPSELLYRVGEAYKKAQTDYKQAIREYSYNHGDLSVLHL